METIDIDWCKRNGMVFMRVNVARDTSYYLEKDGQVVFVYTTSTGGEQKLYVRNPELKREAELTFKKYNRSLTETNALTTDELERLCGLVGLEYPFSK